MKNFILGIITTITVTGSAAYAGLFDSIATSDWPTVESQNYKVEAYGYDVRAYDWERSDGKICTMAFHQNGAVGLDCE